MSAMVCNKRSLFDDIHGSPPIAKRIRCGGNSPVHFQPVVSPVRIGSAGVAEVGPQGRSTVSYLDDQLTQLRAQFSEIDGQLVERVYESCGKNVDSSIKSLNDLRFSSSEEMSPPCESAVHTGNPVAAVPTSTSCVLSNEGYVQSSTIRASPRDLELPQSTEGLEWVEMLVKEMMSAANLDDARLRASRALEAFEKTVALRSGMTAEVLKKENTALKDQLQGLLRDNHFLKRAVAIQQERQTEHEERSRELQTVKQMLSQHQEQLRMLEMNNYALSWHLGKAREGNSIPGRFDADLF